MEPLFAFAFIRNVMDGDELIEVHPILRAELERRGLYSDELMQQIIAEGSLQHIPEIPEDIKRVFVCAHDVSPEWHIRMQAAFQQNTDNAVSKTVNFPNAATREEVRQVYRAGLPPGLQRRDHLPGRQPGIPGAQHRQSEQQRGKACRL